MYLSKSHSSTDATKQIRWCRPARLGAQSPSARTVSTSEQTTTRSSKKLVAPLKTAKASFVIAETLATASSVTPKALSSCPPSMTYSTRTRWLESCGTNGSKKPSSRKNALLHPRSIGKAKTTALTQPSLAIQPRKPL